ncbi:P-type conjugative transfer ATPase TrbB [Azospirillum thermophilum]|uniref:P-type conjugative transfer ATPase TrbB n=1 Tax=Azospirillum thermophilum TaxID=2202148 RepID=UPI001FE51BB1|nr:P-type conjugative transfer ATPase TrbB [Azospirillum thermophilum]
MCGFLAEPDVVEIALNPDGRLWVERLGQEMMPVGTMSASQAESLMTTVAAALRTTITRDNPILECELPFDGSRFEALIPPVVAAPTFAIRRKASRIFTLDEYVERGIMTGCQRAVLVEAVAARRNILVVGGTGTGKTTLTNALIKEIERATPHDRLIIIEDTVELQCAAANVVQLRTAEHVGMQRLLAATMRLRPTRILVGETRGPEALSMLKAWNTGHPGGVATVHANTSDSAGTAGLIRLESLIAEATAASWQRRIAEAVNIIVNIEKTSASPGRRISAVLAVDGFDGTDYVLSQLG